MNELSSVTEKGFLRQLKKPKTKAILLNVFSFISFWLLILFGICYFPVSSVLPLPVNTTIFSLGTVNLLDHYWVLGWLFPCVVAVLVSLVVLRFQESTWNERLEDLFGRLRSIQYRYGFTSPSTLFLVVIWGFLNILWSIGPIYTYWKEETKTGINIQNALTGLSRGIIWIVIWNNCLTIFWITVKASYSWKSSFGLNFIDGIFLHKVCGVIIVLAAFLHGSMFILKYGLKGNLKDQLWPETPIGVVNTAGIAALIVLLFIGFTSLPFFRRKYFEFFKASHYLFILYFFLITLHWVPFMYTLIPAMIVYLFDWIFLSLSSRKFSKLVTLKKVPGTDTLRMEIFARRGKILPEYFPRQFVKIKINNISQEWHSFSIASSYELNCSSIVLYCKSCGDWTRKLLKLANKGFKELSVETIGFFGDKSEIYLNFEKLVLIAGGVGITPFIGMIGSMLMKYKNNEYMKLREITLIWTTKFKSDFLVLADILKQTFPTDIDFNIKFITTAERTKIEGLREILQANKETIFVCTNKQGVKKKEITNIQLILMLIFFLLTLLVFYVIRAFLLIPPKKYTPIAGFTFQWLEFRYWFIPWAAPTLIPLCFWFLFCLCLNYIRIPERNRKKTEINRTAWTEKNTEAQSSHSASVIDHILNRVTPIFGRKAFLEEIHTELTNCNGCGVFVSGPSFLTNDVTALAAKYRDHVIHQESFEL